MDLPFAGLLFDLDGTLVDSSEAISRAWAVFAHKYEIDADEFLPSIQGKPASETVALLRPGASALDIKEDCKWLETMETKDTDGVVALPGAGELLNALKNRNIPWAIVTSGTLPVATARIKAADLPLPKVLVTPELVSQGKPAPDSYLLGASQLGLNIENCIVFEDAPAGVISGVQAGAKVVGMLTQFKASELLAQKADICISSLLHVSFSFDGDISIVSINELVGIS